MSFASLSDAEKSKIQNAFSQITRICGNETPRIRGEGKDEIELSYTALSPESRKQGKKVLGILLKQHMDNVLIDVDSYPKPSATEYYTDDGAFKAFHLKMNITDAAAVLHKLNDLKNTIAFNFYESDIRLAVISAQEHLPPEIITQKLLESAKTFLPNVPLPIKQTFNSLSAKQQVALEQFETSISSAIRSATDADIHRERIGYKLQDEAFFVGKIDPAVQAGHSNTQQMNSAIVRERFDTALRELVAFGRSAGLTPEQINESLLRHTQQRLDDSNPAWATRVQAAELSQSSPSHSGRN